LKTLLLLASAFFLIGGCMNPTDVVDAQKKEFKEQYKDNFYTYTSDGQKMSAAWSGNENKRPLILIHGSPGSYDSWAQFLVSADLQAKFHIIVPDRPGYGGSGAGRAELSVEKQGRAIWDALQFNKSGLPAILVGHSYGGPVIARMAMDRPDKTAGLIFVASSVDPQLEEFKWYQNIAIWSVTRWMVPTDLVVCNDEIVALKAELERMLPLWSKITAATAIIQGDADDMVDPRNTAFITKNLTKGPIVSSQMVTGLNHFVPWKRPDLILDSIRDVENQITKK
jgi:pimeloyl-ACP methyl ester carboxylesterase